MTLSKQDREEFLMRMGTVGKARLESDGDLVNSDLASLSEKWSDSDIEMAIAMGF